MIFSFALGGLGVAGYRAWGQFPVRVIDDRERATGRHRGHLLALSAPFLVFAALVGLPWNPIYPGIVAMALAAASVLCRPDLWRNTLLGGVLFLGMYTVLLFGLKGLQPGYIEAVWNLDALLGWHPWGLLLVELLFGFAFGMYWSGIYEHLTWHRTSPTVRRTPSGEKPAGLHARASE